MLDACQNLSKGSCPVKRGDELTYRFVETIVGVPITSTVQIEFALRDDIGKNIACARFDAKVYSKPRVQPFVILNTLKKAVSEAKL